MPASLGARRALRSRRASGAVAAFDPSTISGLQVWFKADALALSEGNAVSSFTDSSSNARHATQAVGAAQPTYRATPTGFNGKPAVQFDGGDSLATAGFGISIFTVFAVWKASALSCIYSHQANATTPFFLESDNLVIFSRRAGGISSYTKSAGWGNDNAVRVTCHTFDGNHAGHLLYINGALESLTNSGTSNPGTSTITGPFQLGVVTSGDLMAGHTAEIICYDSVLSTANRNAVTAYLGSKYAVSVV